MFSGTSSASDGIGTMLRHRLEEKKALKETTQVSSYGFTMALVVQKISHTCAFIL